MTDLFIDNWTPQRAERYQERMERWLAGEVVSRAKVVRDDKAIAEREQRLAQMQTRPTNLLRWRA